MNYSLSARFFQALRWNLTEAVPYQLIFPVHQAVLCMHIDSTLYGLTGSLFSLLYLLITISNAGFDAAIPAASIEGFASRAHFRRSFMVGYIPTLLLLLGGAALAPWLVQWYAVTTLGSEISGWVTVSISCLVVLEGIRKTLRVVLHTAFYNKQTALIELAHLSIYLALVWGCYGFGIPLNETLLFGALVATSLISTGILAMTIRKFYYGLALDMPTVKQASWSSVACLRIGTSMLVVSHQIFSGNFLVPLCGYSLGLHEAGTVNILCSLAYSATVCLRKIFGPTSEALFAHAKRQGLKVQQQAFRLVTAWLYTLASGLLIGSLLTLWWFARSCSTGTQLYWYAGMFLFLTLSEQFFTVYENLFIIEGRITPLVALTISTLFLLGCALHFAQHLPLWYIVLLLLGIRLISFMCMSLLSFIWWRIAPSYSLRPLHIASIVCAMVSIFFWF